MNPLAAKLAILIAFALGGAISRAQAPLEAQASAALAHRSQFAPDDQPHKLYFTLWPTVDTADQQERSDLITAMRFVFPHLSFQPLVERCIPQPIAPGSDIHFVDARDLGWRLDDWYTIAKAFPYQETFSGRFKTYAEAQDWVESRALDFPSRKAFLNSAEYKAAYPDIQRAFNLKGSYSYGSPLIRLDWFIVQATDSKESNFYDLLLYSGKIPANQTELRQKIRAVDDPFFNTAYVEGTSGVSVSGTRIVRRQEAVGGHYIWTQDTKELTGDRDALEHPDGTAPYDGIEAFFALPKVLRTPQGVIRAHLYGAILFNGQDKIVAEAPADLVVDHSNFRGHPIISYPGKCWSCHTQGLIMPSRDLFKDFVSTGGLTFSDYKQNANIELLLLSGIEQQILEGSEGYQRAVELSCLMPCPEAIQAYKRAVNRYDSPLDLIRASEEHGVTVEEFSTVVALGAGDVDVGARYAMLPKNGLVDRRRFEVDWYTYQKYVQAKLPELERE